MVLLVDFTKHWKNECQWILPQKRRGETFLTHSKRLGLAWSKNETLSASPWPACAQASSPRSFPLCSRGACVSARDSREASMSQAPPHTRHLTVVGHTGGRCPWSRARFHHLPEAGQSAPGPQGRPGGPAAQGDSVISLWLWLWQALGWRFPYKRVRCMQRGWVLCMFWWEMEISLNWVCKDRVLRAFEEQCPARHVGQRSGEGC